LLLVIGLAPFTSAAANEITNGVDTYSYASGASTHSIVFQLATGNLAAGDVIELTFPAPEMPVKAAQTAVVDLGVDSAGATFDADATTAVASTTTVDTASRNHYRIVLSDALTTGTPTWVRVSGLQTGETSQLTAGDYSIHISTYDSTATSTVVETGVAIATLNNGVGVSAVVDETLIFTLDTTNINLRVDPSVNNGIDQTQSNILTISTNAPTYSITTSLNNGGKLITDGGGAGKEITTAIAGENTFAFNTTSAGAGDTAFGDNAVTAATGITNNVTHTVFYDLDVDYTIQAGTYTGTITYTAVPTF
jgi:hypothetical protein